MTESVEDANSQGLKCFCQHAKCADQNDAENEQQKYNFKFAERFLYILISSAVRSASKFYRHRFIRMASVCHFGLCRHLLPFSPKFTRLHDDDLVHLLRDENLLFLPDTKMETM